MKWACIGVAASQIGVLALYASWAASADYFVRMPPSVRRGDSVAALVAWRVAWLALVFLAFDASVAAWIRGVRAFRTSKTATPWLAFLASITMFVAACVLLTTFVVFSIPQY